MHGNSGGCYTNNGEREKERQKYSSNLRFSKQPAPLALSVQEKRSAAEIARANDNSSSLQGRLGTLGDRITRTSVLNVG